MDGAKQTETHRQEKSSEPAGLEIQVQQPLVGLGALIAQTRQDPSQLSPANVLQLQRLVGNRAVSQALAGSRLGNGPIQAKLTVGPANDRYEQEADSVAARVVSMMGRGGGEPQAASSKPQATSRNQQAVQRQEEEEKVQTKSVAARISPLVQREAAPEEEEIQTKPILQRQEDEEEVQTKPLIQRRGDGGFEAGPTIEKRLSASRGGGRPLPAGIRTSMESSFGADFGSVRLHTGTEAAQLNADLRALAFTHGRDVYLGANAPQMGSSDGQRLLAHELTHTIQQGGTTIRRKIARNKGVEWPPTTDVIHHLEPSGDEEGYKIVKFTHKPEGLVYTVQRGGEPEIEVSDQDLAWGVKANARASRKAFDDAKKPASGFTKSAPTVPLDITAAKLKKSSVDPMAEKKREIEERFRKVREQPADTSAALQVERANLAADPEAVFVRKEFGTRSTIPIGKKGQLSSFPLDVEVPHPSVSGLFNRLVLHAGLAADAAACKPFWDVALNSESGRWYVRPEADLKKMETVQDQLAVLWDRAYRKIRTPTTIEAAAAEHTSPAYKQLKAVPVKLGGKFIITYRGEGRDVATVRKHVGAIAKTDVASQADFQDQNYVGDQSWFPVNNKRVVIEANPRVSMVSRPSMKDAEETSTISLTNDFITASIFPHIEDRVRNEPKKVTFGPKDPVSGRIKEPPKDTINVYLCGIPMGTKAMNPLHQKDVPADTTVFMGGDFQVRKVPLEQFWGSYQVERSHYGWTHKEGHVAKVTAYTEMKPTPVGAVNVGEVDFAAFHAAARSLVGRQFDVGGQRTAEEQLKPGKELTPWVDITGPSIPATETAEQSANRLSYDKGTWVEKPPTPSH